ncbi:MAG: nitroreductase family deazaflavin-dependent oxidoreductase [Candidatus Eremiobacteraeota bacterium]|nr:nitroreductase family deazaflavin-dependent oxidoreductase [Candidatus Eremiobacteraeota bacterium]MCW5867155.1 nitroreductase family deazaflavin-dependent oxidoreductase [Candidatus Eremiobacteraeota bacterium]
MNIFRYTGRLHCWLYRLTSGVFTGLASGTPVLLLTTTGRKSGRHFTTPLLFLPDREDLVVVASYAGRDQDPQWWKNLQAHPEGSVQVGPHRWRVRAEPASEELKKHLWPVFCRYYPQYQEYQKKTSRVIPLVVLKML